MATPSKKIARDSILCILLAALLFSVIAKTLAPVAAVETLIVIDRGNSAWPLFPRTPKANIPFTKLVVIVGHLKGK